MQSSESLLGTWLNSRFPRRTRFFHFCISFCKGWFLVGSSARTPHLRQTNPKLLPCYRRFFSPPCSSVPGQQSQGTKHLTKAQQGKTALESNMISYSNCGWGLASLLHKVWVCFCFVLCVCMCACVVLLFYSPAEYVQPWPLPACRCFPELVLLLDPHDSMKMYMHLTRVGPGAV